jgi:hypothetical protein
MGFPVSAIKDELLFHSVETDKIPLTAGYFQRLNFLSEATNGCCLNRMNLANPVVFQSTYWDTISKLLPTKPN